MRASLLLSVILSFGLTASRPNKPIRSILPTEPSSDLGVAADQVDALAEYARIVALDSLNRPNNGTKRQCSKQTLSIRKEWGTLKATEKKAYINAALCLQRKAAKTPSLLAPGAKSRFDDFVATHINQTLTIHYTGTFLSWHRWFTWEYEQALRNECGYTGTQPYWDWSKSAVSGLAKSPVWDGSDLSMSGDGQYIAGQGEVVLGGGSTGLPAIYLPAGTGGGCVKSGPFRNMTVNLGPADLALTNGTTLSATNPLAYNPRCLKRDLTDYVNRAFANASSISSLLLQSSDIYDFQMSMQGVPGSGNLGVHGGGHYSMGGDPGRDVYVSPGDPAFYLHHSMIDRTWWIWQMQNSTARLPQLAQTGTYLDSPSSPNTTLDTVIDLGYAAGNPTKVGDLISTIDGLFCYVYE